MLRFFFAASFAAGEESFFINIPPWLEARFHSELRLEALSGSGGGLKALPKMTGLTGLDSAPDFCLASSPGKHAAAYRDSIAHPAHSADQRGSTLRKQMATAAARTRPSVGFKEK